MEVVLVVETPVDSSGQELTTVPDMGLVIEVVFKMGQGWWQS